MNSEKHHEWNRIFDAWERSGIPQRRFCMENNLSYPMFRYHRCRINREKAALENTQLVKLTPSKLTNIVKTASPLTLHLGDSIKIDIPAGFDSSSLIEVLNVLEVKV